MNNINKFILITFLLLITSVLSAENETASKEISLDNKTLNSFDKINPFISLLPKKLPEIKIDDVTLKTNINIKDPSKNKIDQNKNETPKPTSPPTLIISGVIWNTDRPQAIINGQVVNQGDIVAGSKIVSIRKTGIDIIFQDVNFTIKP